jgi:conjugative relaxase-like TrwC/TraI family protein
VVTVRVTTLKGTDAGTYYVEQLPRYYLDANEPPGRWHGRGAQQLGLAGDVLPDAFVDVIAGLMPGTDVQLGRTYDERSVRGFDVTASAPKSVSVLFAVADDDTRRVVLEAHDHAVAAMVGWIEDHAHTRYRIHGDVAVVDAEGIVAASFRQHTSRALDPQLHTHVVIANRVMSPDGRWLALDARTIKHDQRTLSALYHATLRAELTHHLGVRWHEPENGIAELADVPDHMRSEFSTRTNTIRHRLDHKLDRFHNTMDRAPTPRERWALEREAVLDSRPSKQRPRDGVELHDRWRHQLAALGIEPDDLVAGVSGQVSGRVSGRPLTAADIEQLTARALESLAERQSTFRPAELTRELAAALPTDTPADSERLVEFLDQLTDQIVAERAVDLSRLVPAGVRLRRDGRPVTEAATDRVLTTPPILEQEAAILDAVERRLEPGGHDARIDPDATVDLTRPQAEAAAAVAGDRQLVLVVGPAGTGKTTALTPGLDSLHHQGRAVFGVAPTATAAQVLGFECGIDADTIDKLLHEHRSGRPRYRYDLPAGTTVVLDEAGMTSTPNLAELIALADQRAWRLVLVGDPFQFSAVGRGGMFTHLVDLHGGIELDRVHRFEHAWERDASLRLRRGDPGVLDVYEAHGRIHDGPALSVQRQLLNSWWNARERGETVAMVAPTNDLAAELNRAAQQRRLDAGHLHSDRYLAVGDTRLHVADEIVTRRNDRSLITDGGRFVKNHDHWTIRRITPDGSLAVAGQAGHVRLPADYVTEHVQLGYATTGHAAQGRTVDRSLLYLDAPTDCRNLYVPLTRGRHSNDVYVALRDERTARDILETSLAIDRVDQPAHAARRDTPTLPAATVADRPLEPVQLAGTLMDHHLAQIAHRQHQHEIAERVAAIDELRDRQQAIPQEVAQLDAANRRDRTEIDSLKRGLGSLRNRGQIRALEDRVDDRGRQRAALIAEHMGLAPRLSAAERAHAAVVDRGPDPAAAELADLELQLDADLTARLEALTPDEYLDLERRLGPRSTDVDFGDAWDQVAGTTLQHRAVKQLAGDVPEQAAQLASQLTGGRVDQASHHFDNQRLIQRLNSLQQPERDLGRALGRDGPDRGLSL